MSTSVTSPDLDLADLAAALRGEALQPADEGYAALAMPWNVAVPSRPRAVVAAADAADVVTAVRWARRHRVPVAVRATGHGAADALDGVLLIRTDRLAGIRIDADGSARVGAGVTWGALAHAAARRGFAPLGGSAPTVGVVGLLTGGGLGPLARSFGVCSDRVTAVEVVTGDGVLRRATAEQEPDLFWALRGGKGALGIVTAVELDLLPDATLLAGALFFDGVDAAAVLHAWAGWCPTLPEDATTSIALLRLPPVPGVPAELGGRLAVAVRFAWTGDPDAGRDALEPIRTAAPVILGGVGPMPASAVGAIHGDPEQPTPSHERAVALQALPPAAVDALLATAGPASDCSLLVVEVRQLGGRIAREECAPSAFPGRDVAFSVLGIGIAVGPMAAGTAEHAARLANALTPWAGRGRLPNFEPTSDRSLVARTYGAERARRLAELIAAYDPDGVVQAADPLRAPTGPR